MAILTQTWSRLDEKQRAKLLQRPAVVDDVGIRTGTAAIIEEVRRDGDAALRRLTLEYDRAEIDELRVSDEELERAEKTLSGEQVDAIDLAINNVRIFHHAQMNTDIRVETMQGVVCERVSHPIDAVGLYVPAGTAPLPSAAIMLAVPADMHIVYTASA
jgi:histidinol dehydrogenase